MTNLYRLLRQAQVFETEEISSTLYLLQNQHKFVHVKEKGGLHIQEVNGVLEIYVPQDPQSQGICYFLDLPRGLLEWMMRDPTEESPTQHEHDADQRALRILTSILNTPSIAGPHILEREGIIEVDLPKDDDLTSDDEKETCTSPVEPAAAVATPRKEPPPISQDSGISISSDSTARTRSGGPPSRSGSPLPLRQKITEPSNAASTGAVRSPTTSNTEKQPPPAFLLGKPSSEGSEAEGSEAEGSEAEVPTEPQSTITSVPKVDG